MTDKDNNSNNKILEFFIFHRNGTCLCHLDNFEKNSNNYVNKAINITINKENEHRYKLIYGMLFSMKSFVKTLSPKKNDDSLKMFVTSNYKLHYIEFINGLRFLFLTTPKVNYLGEELRNIHKLFYTNLISKNVFINLEEQIKNEIFIEKVSKYIENITI
jgi:hypothetical protein